MIKQILRNYQFLSLEQLHVDQGIFFFPSKKRKRSMLSPFHLKLHKTVSRSFEKSELTLIEALSTSQMLPLKPKGNNVSSSSSVSISHQSLPYSYYNASSIIMPLAIAWILTSFLQQRGCVYSIIKEMLEWRFPFYLCQRSTKS